MWQPQPGCHLPDSPWPGKKKLFPTRESLVSDIPPGWGRENRLPFFTVCDRTSLGGNGTAPTCVVGGVGAAVVGWLGHHVREVDSLPEHVAGHRGFGGRNPQTLQTTDIQTIPMKTAVIHSSSYIGRDGPQEFTFSVFGRFYSGVQSPLDAGKIC